MKLPISKRLLLCAELVPPCRTVADVGTDHGYLGIFLLTEGRAETIAACDLREGPLSSAKRNAAKYGVSDRMDFCLSDGLRDVPRDGYDTVVADNGGNLSAGQRQLLALARAVLSDPPILILDEATSSVDTRTELHIQRIMKELMRDRTTFVIAHRLGTIRDADCIFAVDNGVIAERGTHAELMAQRGVYWRMYTSQFRTEAP